MRKLTKDETATATTTVKAKHVALRRTVKTDANSPERFELELTLDFNGLDLSEILDIAAGAVWINIQRQFRDAAKANNGKVRAEEWERTWNVKEEIVAKARRPADPVSSALKQADKMTDEQIANMVAALQAKLKK